MPQIQYAFRDDEKTISLLVQGCTEKSPICQIVTLSKWEIMPEFLNQFIALDIKGSSYPATALTDLGRNTNTNEAYRHCLVKVHSQIEFTVKQRLMRQLGEYFPAYNATGLYNFFNGQPYGYIIVLQVFETTTEIPDSLMARGRLGSAQIIQLYDQNGQKTYFDIAEPITPLIDEGIFENIRDEIIHELRVENALVGIYGDDEDSKRLLRQKRNARNDGTGQYKRTYDENEDSDYAFSDFDEIYRKIIELDPSLAGFVANVREIKAPQMVECQTLIPRAQSGDEAARTRLVEMYIRNVLRIALYYTDKFHLPIADTIQDGLVGLVISVDKFDQGENTKYQTYFPFWVRRAIQRGMLRSIYTRYFPVHVHKTLMSICAIADKLGITMPPDTKERKLLLPQICKEMTLTEEQAEELLNYFDTTYESFDEILIQLDENDEAAEDYPCLVVADAVWESVADKELKDTVAECVDTLKPREKKVITLRYGLNGDDPKTLEEVGNMMGVTRERIRQIEAKGIQRLQYHTRRTKLVDFL